MSSQPVCIIIIIFIGLIITRLYVPATLCTHVHYVPNDMLNGARHNTLVLRFIFSMASLKTTTLSLSAFFVQSVNDFGQSRKRRQTFTQDFILADFFPGNCLNNYIYKSKGELVSGLTTEKENIDLLDSTSVLYCACGSTLRAYTPHTAAGIRPDPHHLLGRRPAVTLTAQPEELPPEKVCIVRISSVCACVDLIATSCVESLALKYST